MVSIYILLRSFLIPKGHNYTERDYDLKSTLYSEGTYFIEGTMLLRPFLIPKGHSIPKGTMVLITLIIPKGQKRKGRSGSEVHRAERGRREKKFSTTQ